MKRIVLLLLIVVSQTVAQTEYVRDWLILGTFPNPDAASRLTKDYLNGELSISPRGGDVIAGRRWFLYHSPREFVDFLWADFDFSARERCVVYAAFFVQSPAAQNVRLTVGSDDAISVFCNGRIIHQADVVRGLVADNDTVDVSLVAGWNTMILKVANNEGGYGASAKFADGSDLVLTAENPFPGVAALTPPKLEYNASSFSFKFRFANQNAAIASIELPLKNIGSSQARSVTVELLSAPDVLLSSQRLTLAGGELKKVLIELPMKDALRVAASGKPLSLRLAYLGRDTIFSLPLADEFLSKLFQPWELNGWQVERPDEKTERRTRSIVVPEELTGLHIRLAVDIGDSWGSLSVNGTPVLPRFSGDSGELTLTSNATKGESYRIELVIQSELALKKNLVVGSTFRPQSDRIERYALDKRFAREIYHLDVGDQTPITIGILQSLERHDFSNLDEILGPFERSIAPYADSAKALKLHMIGNAHIDMAWLWRYTETIEVTRATFRSALDNLRRYPDFRFSHGQAHSYAWIESKDPEMFREIQQYVQEGRWEITGGTWVESDGNMPGGESFVRQYLYGKRYFKSRFNVDVVNGYHPDTFGHAASLPQILARSGMQTYTFFRPGETERMFWWEAADGSRVFAHHPSNWYGTWSGIPDTLWTSAEKSRKNFGATDVVQFFGVGDHGGGPTRRQIEQIEQLSSIQLYPKTRMSSFQNFYQSLVPQKQTAPIERGEQNFVFEGCYTSQAAIKMNNRKAEALLPAAEIFSSIAASFGEEYKWPQLEEAWHKILFNQFHDILCGSGIHDVALDAELFYAEAFVSAESALKSAFSRIASNVNTTGGPRNATPILLFNPLSWKRNDPVVLSVPAAPDKSPRILDLKGGEVASQVIERKPDSATIVLLAKDVPSIGYSTYWLSTQKEKRIRASTTLIIENHDLRVEVDSVTGSVSKMFDKRSKRELVKPGQLLNQMQIQEDDAPMSAWVIGLKGEPVALTSPTSVKVVESGPVRSVIRTEYRLEQSTFIQDVMLYAGRPVIDFRFQADWHHRKRLLKIRFPLEVNADKVICDIPFGAIERPADGREIVAQKWVDLSSQEYGIALLNDAKYGFDVKGTTIRITALRSPTDPDPKADEGFHEFHYALYPHVGDWRAGEVARRGYEFNSPLLPFAASAHRGSLPANFSFVQIDNPELILAAMKKAEDDQDLVLRVYESSGRAGQGSISLWRPFSGASETDLIEWNAKELESYDKSSRKIQLVMKPTEIKTLKIKMEETR